MTDVTGNPEEERHAEFYYQPFMQEGVCRYFYSKVSWRPLVVWLLYMSLLFLVPNKSGS